jgi:hypothetical protein
MTNAMRKRQPRRLWAAWLALLVALWGAMAPAVSHALVFAKVGANGLSNSIEICTSQGPRVVSLQGDASADSLASSSPQPETARTLDHCPLCLHAPGHAAPPAHPQPYFVQLDDGVQAHTRSPTHFVPTAPFSRASPRSPPALS